MKLHIETETWTLQGTGEDVLTQTQYNALEWPPCPVCGGVTTGYPVNVRGEGPEPHMRVSPMWNCRKGCQPGRGAIGGESTGGGLPDMYHG